jgi:glycosyltransferase involved in cell wall biosynthesis
LLSLEPWDEVWRRNQHLAAQLVEQRLVDRILFLNPPTAARPMPPFEPVAGVTVIPTVRRIPKRAGGTAVLGHYLRKGVLSAADLLWINDPSLGSTVIKQGQPAIYDVTDDWRTVPAPRRVRRRVILAEDLLAHRATTVVCSDVLRRRWRQRYGIVPAVVRNGVDAAAWSRASPDYFEGSGPHVGYVGTLHDERLDVPLILALAEGLGEATIHLVGPSSLTAASTTALEAHPRIRLHGQVPADRVPSTITALDVLICPHRVSEFTLSLDAIKAYEYAASGRPIVATPTSGFQELAVPQLTVRSADRFIDAVKAALAHPPASSDTTVASWAQRAREFRATWPC